MKTIKESGTTDNQHPEKPLVSVVIPTYNRAGFLPDAIGSVLAQSYANIEIIVIDDGSTDNTRSVLQPFEDKIRYLTSNHVGAAHARNMGMMAAKGKYIAFLDSDDQYLPGKLALQIEFLEKNPELKVVCSNFSGKREDGEVDDSFLRRYHFFWERRGLAYKVSLRKRSVCQRNPEYGN